MPYREFLVFQHLLDEGPERLRQRNGQITHIICIIANFDRLGDFIYIHTMFHQEVDQTDHLPCIVLFLRNNIIIRRLGFTFHDFLPAQVVPEFQDILLVLGCRPQHRIGTGFFVLHQVAQSPPAARPGVGHIDALFILRQSFPPHSDFIRFDIYRGGDIDRSSFRKHADHILPDTGFGRSRPVIIKKIALRDPFQPAGGHIVDHVRAEQPDPGKNPGIHIFRDRIMRRRHEIPDSGCPHLMLLHHHLREPVFIVDGCNRPGIRLAKADEIPVVVVPHILVIHPGEITPFVLRPFVLIVIIDDQIHPVRIVAGNHHKDHFVE